MRTPHRGLRLLAVLLALASLAPALPVAGAAGHVVQFPRPGTNDTIQRYDDTVFVGLGGVTAVTFDEHGDIWYTAPGGVVHQNVTTGLRTLYTAMNGLPSSLALDVAATRGKVYVSADNGLAVIDEATGIATPWTHATNPNLPADVLVAQDPDAYSRSVAVVGDEVWFGTHSSGLGILNLTTNSWFFKNTSTGAFLPRPVRNVNVDDATVWVATDGNGAWRFDRANGNVQDPAAWSNVTQDKNGLFNNHLIDAKPVGGDVFFATHFGIARWRPSANGTPDEWKRYTNTSGDLPSNYVNKLSRVPTQGGGPALIADTGNGAWQLQPDTGANATLTADYGIYGAFVADDAYDDSMGWAFGTSRGVSWLQHGVWTYYTTGPSSGASNGPGSCADDYRFTSGGVGGSGSFLWFGRPEGISAYQLPQQGKPGRFYNLGLLQNNALCNGATAPVTWIQTDGNDTWFSTFSGTWGLDWVHGKWLSTPWKNGISYGVDSSQGDVWIAAFGGGIARMNQTTGVGVFYNKTTSPTFPDDFTTDVRLTPNEAWVGAASGVIRLNRVTGGVVNTYTYADGLPGDGFVYRVLPDGASVYVGLRTGGVARLDVASGKVTRVWNHTTDPSFPDTEVDVLYRDGRYLYAGTHGGLVRIDVTTGQERTFAAADGLVQEFVTGIGEADGILYLSTYAGIARFDTLAQTFLPMQDGPGVVRVGPGATGTASGSVGGAGALSVRIDSPRDGSAVTGLVTLKGSAFRLGGDVDRVQVKIGDADWKDATGAESWTYAWDTTTGPLNGPIEIAARALAGNDTSPEAHVLLTPVPEPKVQLTVKPTMPPSWTAGRDLDVTVYATGDDPLVARLYYRPEGASTYTMLPLTRQGATSYFGGTIPGRDIVAGNLTWYAEAGSGLLVATSPDDVSAPNVLPIAPAPTLDVEVTGPASVTATAGVATPIPLTLRNAGSQSATVTLAGEGVRKAWLTLPTAAITLAPGETRLVNATFAPPAAAVADTTSLSFVARDASGVALATALKVPVTIQAAGAAPTPASPAGKSSPGFELPALGLALALALGLARRRRA
ncbi:MAG: hypothetical protein QOE90_2435 [Thermoplasmata archaeon]|jgi:hypothetical protein|nr:hypothetical protein [Thermoplasmata archaeon]